MKDKNLAAVLAFFGGFFGLHRFYLGQTGLGILYICMPGFNAMLGVLDAIIFLSMDQDTFDEKYNTEEISPHQRSSRRSGDRYDRYRQRELDRRNRRGKRTTAPSRKMQRKTDSRKGIRQRKSRSRGNTPIAPANPDREEGIKYFKDFDYEEAIAAFERSLKIEPKDIATHWNLACAYSLTEDVDKSLYHLDRAVAFGFDDFDRLSTHDALAYVRVQPQYQILTENKYRLVADLPTPDNHNQGDLLSQTPETDENAPPRTNVDLLEQLQQLGNLREKGLLSEAEFAAQKRKLLG